MKMPPSVYTPAPKNYRMAQWLRFFFRRLVVQIAPPENLGFGLRQVVVLECGHSFHVKPRKRLFKRMGCAGCALEWVKRLRDED